MPWSSLTRSVLQVALLLAGVLAAIAATSPTQGASDTPAARPMATPDLVGACDTDNPYLITACYADFPEKGPNPPAVVAFNDTRNDGPHVTLASEREVGSIWGLAFSGRHQTVYAAAYHKRQMPFGPGGPGAVYQIDLASGAVSVLATVPNAGEDHHERSALRTSDDRARPWVGKTSLGDLDVNAVGTELYVTNLYDRKIYRYGLPDGALLGSFDHGAAGEEWSAEARPFALKSYGGCLYHGVVRTGEESKRRDNLSGHVYSSASDGAEMRLVAEIPLSYPRGTVAIGHIWSWYRYFDNNILLNWQTWIDNIHVRSRATDWNPATVYPMPIVADIEFDGTGDMVLGIKDRTLDAGLTPRDFESPALLYDYRRLQRIEWPAIGAGDTLRGKREGDRWVFDPGREHYVDGHKSMDETNLSGLAMLAGPELLVSAAISMGDTKWNGMPWRVDRGAKWYETGNGRRVSLESVCSAPVDTHY